MGHSLDFGGGADGLIGLKTALGVNQVRGEDSVDQSRLSETSLAYQTNSGQLIEGSTKCGCIDAIARAGIVNVPTQITLNWKPLFRSLRSI